MKKHYEAREILRVHYVLEQLEKKIRRLKNIESIERDVINSLMRECYTIRKVLDLVDLSLAVRSMKRRQRKEAGVENCCCMFHEDVNIDMLVEEHKKVKPVLSKEAQKLKKILDERYADRTDDDFTIKGLDEKRASQAQV